MTAATTHPDSDEEIIHRIRGGDARSFALLVDRHKERGMALAHSMLRSREEAEEALQDAFVRAFRALPKFEMKSSFATWFYRIVYNVCATRMSRAREGSSHLSDIDGDLVERQEDTGPLPDVQFESDQAAAIIREEIDRLPEAYGTTFLLFAVHEKSYDEIVEITGVALGTVKARIFRARAILRDAVAAQLELSGGRNKKKEQAA